MPFHAAASLPVVEGAVISTYALVQALLAVYCSHRFVTLARWWRHRRRAEPPRPPAPDAWPIVTVQLPLYNEPAVAGRLLEAVASLRYPRDRLEVQVLDDSTDATTELMSRAVERHRASGLDVRLIHRSCRAGYKAGALAEGLRAARGEIVAVFDSDFVPPPNFLERLAPHFADPTVGMVQARWGHLNRGPHGLTEAQAVMLDAHFLVEHAARMGAGLFFNFNGSAGIWRRSCIESAGGWTSDTLTEDLDLSYRAQLEGWRFVFDPSVTVPAELPAEVTALKTQQYRWVKGSIQTARKILPRIAGSPLPARVKLEAFCHLTGNAVYPLSLALSALLLPLLVVTRRSDDGIGALEGAIVLSGLVPLVLFLALGQALAGAPARRIAGGVLWALVLGAGLSLNDSRAVFSGLSRRLGEWRRTPKRGGNDRSASASGDGGGRSGGLELALAAYFAAVACVAVATERLRALPFVLLFVVGFALVGRPALAARRRPRIRGALRAA